MKRILLAVGDTQTSIHTARQIRPWLRERGTSLTLLAVAPSSPLSLDSPIKQTLEQVESVFTGADETPGIVVRIGSVPAKEICREAGAGGYDLLAIGLRGQHRSEPVIGETCRDVLRACPVSMFVTPPASPVGQTPQILVIVPPTQPLPAITDWLAAQCLAQKLNVILCANAAQDAEPLGKRLNDAKIRTQVVVRPGLFPEGISLLERDRRVRWIVAPCEDDSTTGSPYRFGEDLLSRASCPVLLVKRAASSCPPPTDVI